MKKLAILSPAVQPKATRFGGSARLDSGYLRILVAVQIVSSVCFQQTDLSSPKIDRLNNEF